MECFYMSNVLLKKVLTQVETNKIYCLQEIVVLYLSLCLSLSVPQ